MLIQYQEGEFREIYFSPMKRVTESSRTYQGKFEFTIGKAKNSWNDMRQFQMLCVEVQT